MLKPVVVVAVVAASGCMRLRPAEGIEQLSPGVRVEMTFAEPRDLPATRDTAAYQLRAVTALSGLVQAIRSDTLVVRVGSISANAANPRLPGALLTVVPGRSTQLAAQRLDRERTSILVILLGLAVALAADFNSSFWQD